MKEEKTQAAHIRAVKDFAIFLKRSPDTATPEELRAYQLHMTNAGMTCGRDEMKRHMQFRRGRANCRRCSASRTSVTSWRRHRGRGWKERAPQGQHS